MLVGKGRGVIGARLTSAHPMSFPERMASAAAPLVEESDPAHLVLEPALIEPQPAVRRRSQKTRWNGKGAARRDARARHGGVHGLDLGDGDGAGEENEARQVEEGVGSHGTGDQNESADADAGDDDDVHAGNAGDTHESPALARSAPKVDGNNYSRRRGRMRTPAGSAHQLRPDEARFGCAVGSRAGIRPL